MIFGLIYCDGTLAEKAKSFYDVLQDGMQEMISAHDKDLPQSLSILLSLPTSSLHHWLEDSTEHWLLQAPRDPIFSSPLPWTEAFDNIKESMLDEVFDACSKLPRE